jgi:hypothetical protein
MVKQVFHNNDLFFLQLQNDQPSVAYEIVQRSINCCTSAMGLYLSMVEIDQPSVRFDLPFAGKVEARLERSYIFVESDESSSFDPDLLYKIGRYFPESDICFMSNLEDFLIGMDKRYPTVESEFNELGYAFRPLGRILIAEGKNEIAVLGTIPKDKDFKNFIDCWALPMISDVSIGLSKTEPLSVIGGWQENNYFIGLSFGEKELNIDESFLDMFI